jgi:hypothetical protein
VPLPPTHSPSPDPPLLLHLSPPSAPPPQNGMTALHWAAHHGKPRLIDKLLDKGADMAARDGVEVALALQPCSMAHVRS